MTKKSTHSSAAELSFKFPIIYKHIHICICTHIYMYVHTFTCACIIYHNKSIHAIISCRVIIGIPIKFAVESIVGVWSGVCVVCVWVREYRRARLGLPISQICHRGSQIPPNFTLFASQTTKPTPWTVFLRSCIVCANKQDQCFSRSPPLPPAHPVLFLSQPATPLIYMQSYI